MKFKLTPGWYILVYHDVSWEESPFVQHIGGICPPDVFREHVKICERLGRLVSVAEGMTRFRQNDLNEPLFSFWFDDGLAGVRRYAAPILTEHGITGAISVCSRFTSRTEMFWRYKLSYLQSTNAGWCLRDRLRELGFLQSDLSRHFTLDRFGSDVLAIIDQLYGETTNTLVKKDAFRIFETPQGLLELYQSGWTIANHSAAHYPIGENQVTVSLLDQFVECEQFIKNLVGRESEFWVLPFDRNIDLSAFDVVPQRPRRFMVLMRDKVNLGTGSEDSGFLYRIHSPDTIRYGLARALLAASRASMRT